MLEELWRAYKFDNNLEAKDKIIIHCLPLIRKIASKLSLYLSPLYDLDDLVSVGVVGLIDAIEKYNPSKDASLKTYAFYRIRGEMLDEIRKLAWVPRSVCKKAEKLKKAYIHLEQQMMGPPSEEELARYLDISIKELRKMWIKVSNSTMVSFDGLCCDKESEDFLWEYLEDPKASSPDEKVISEETKKILAQSINSLSEQGKLVLILYYYKRMKMKEIGKIMGVTESRVSEIHSKAILHLRAKLKRAI